MKLLDFGADRDFTDSGNKSMSIMLKPGFAPEEQYRSRGLQGPWTDVYALSATIYRCITGVTPEESVERVHEDQVKPPSMLGIPVDPPQEAALMMGMAVLQKNRFQNVSELYASLYGLQPGTPTAINTSTNVPSASSSHIVTPTPNTPQETHDAPLVYEPAPAFTPSPVSIPTPVADKPKKMTKQKWITAIACGLVAGVLVFAWNMWQRDADRTDSSGGSVKITFEDIPGITGFEIAAVESLQQNYNSFSYGMIMDAEVFLIRYGESGGVYTLFCEWLTMLFGIPFVPTFPEWGDLTDGLSSGMINFTGTNAVAEVYRVFNASTNIYTRTSPIQMTSDMLYSALLPQYRVAIVEGSSTFVPFISLFPNHTGVVFYEAFDEAYNSFVRGDVDVFITGGDYTDDGFIFEVHRNVVHIFIATSNLTFEPIISIVQKAFDSGFADFLN